ncbi:Putative acetyltransferase [BD1-7 clade bacterium]|uniref:Acetyltransferase n=1 Tax=BD1-7 clade bacterium TaxID=2029982 RepID=A0A5S9MWA4_9GAMM|nr:Putative acetyltransferase [BD1-7 clade bacterium]
MSLGELLKAVSLARRIHLYVLSNAKRVYSLLAFQNIEFGKNVSLHSTAEIIATDGGRLIIGNNVLISKNAKILVKEGVLSIGDFVHVGEGTIIVCRESISIGRDSLIAEYVVIRDQDHRVHDRPIRSAGFETAPIHIGEDVWVGAKATILKGSRIGNGAVVGAHSLVNSHIGERFLTLGTPAREIKKL